MKNVKKLVMISVFILFLGLVGCSSNLESEGDVKKDDTAVPEGIPENQDANESETGENVTINVLIPSGSTAMSLAHFAYENPNIGEDVELKFEPYVQGSDPLLAAFTSETSNVIIAPTNLGATLYQKEVPYQLAATLVWGNLYLIGKEELTLEDLAGKTITAFGQGSTPDIVLQNVLKEKGLLDSVTIEYLSSVADVQSMFAAGEIELAVIAEPSLTVLKNKIDGVQTIADFQSEWAELYGGSSYPQASLFVHQDLIKNHPDAVEALLAQVEVSINFANEHPDEMATQAIETGLDMPESVIASSTLNSHLLFKTASEAKDEIQVYLEKLYEFDPKTIGGSLPDDNFYYLNQ